MGTAGILGAALFDAIPHFQIETFATALRIGNRPDPR
jgi:hypothetical protein